jgi:hypothetical protein
MRTSIVILASLVLAGCGGGGSNQPVACSTQTTLVISTTWNSNGTNGSSVSGKVGVPLTATPTITGIPATCLGKETFAVGNSLSLPRGLTLDATTGVISGTPTQAISIGANGLVQMQLPGYNKVDLLAIITILP